MRKDDPADLADELKRPVDSRDRALASSYMGAPTLRPRIVRCQFCGREVAEGWTSERSPDDQLCARCLQLVRDPD